MIQSIPAFVAKPRLIGKFNNERKRYRLESSSFFFLLPFSFFHSAYKQRIWDFSRANASAIRQALNWVDWDRAFNGLNIHERVKFLTECYLNVFHNVVPNKVIIIRSKTIKFFVTLPQGTKVSLKRPNLIFTFRGIFEWSSNYSWKVLVDLT